MPVKCATLPSGYTFPVISYVRVIAGVPELLRRLEAYPELVRGEYPASQDLVYQGQLARGLFLILRGTIYMQTRAPGANLASSLEADENFGILVPSLDALDHRVPATIATARACDILFISRSQLCQEQNLVPLLATPGRVQLKTAEALETDL